MKIPLLISLLLLALPIKAMEDLNEQLLKAVLHENPDPDQIRSLIAAKADVNSSPGSAPDRYPVLHWAVIAENQEVCIVLLEAGANPNTVEYRKNADEPFCYPTPLMKAISSYSDYTKAICLMIEKKADIQVQDQRGCDALWWACQKDRTSICELLLKNKGDANTQDRECNYTSLMLCARNNNADICTRLLRNGAKLHARSNHSGTALHQAALYRSGRAIIAMLSHALFPRKTEAQFLMYSLARLRKTNQIANFLYKEAKSLLAPWLLYGIASKNKQATIDLLQIPDLDSRSAFEYYLVSFLYPEYIDETIQSLIQNQLGNIEL